MACQHYTSNCHKTIEIEDICAKMDAIVENNIATRQGVEAIGKLEQLIGQYNSLEEQHLANCFLLKVGLWYNLGCAYDHIAGDLEKAIMMHRKAIGFNPNHNSAVYNLGTNLLKLGRYEEAEGFLERAVELKPDDTNYLQNYRYAKNRGRIPIRPCYP
jgi:tetratricopeptide (TPR) repeat protein